MPVEIGFCDICGELECEDPEQCDLAREAEEEEDEE